MVTAKVLFDIGAASNGMGEDPSFSVLFAFDKFYTEIELSVAVRYNGGEVLLSYPVYSSMDQEEVNRMVVGLSESGINTALLNHLGKCEKHGIMVFDRADCLECLRSLRKIVGPYETPVRPAVYWIRQSGTDVHKIGWTRFNVEKRRQELLTSSAYVLESILQIECANEPDAVRLEKRLHGILSPYRQQGEWFKCDSTIIRSAFLGEVGTGYANPF